MKFNFKALQMTKANKINDIVICKSDDGQVSFNVNVFEETIWLSQKDMAYLFDCSADNIGLHIRNIFKAGELENISVTEDFSVTASDGKNYKTICYNLDIVISVGYRVNSIRGIEFRKWATKLLKSYLIDGYAINDKRIKDLEDKIDNLSVTLRSELKEEIREIHKALLEIAAKPIIINNHLFSKSSELEEKIIELIDEVISSLKSNNKQVSKLEKAKKDISLLPKDTKARSRLFKFFKEIGDDKSDINKAIKGAAITRNILSELVKLSNKLKDLL